MSLLDDARDESQRDARGARCMTCMWLSKLGDDDRAEVLDAIAAPVDDVRHTALYAVASARWPDIPSEGSFIRHRRGLCRESR